MAKERQTDRKGKSTKGKTHGRCSSSTLNATIPHTLHPFLPTGTPQDHGTCHISADKVGVLGISPSTDRQIQAAR
jgi:hypothetical protein